MLDFPLNRVALRHADCYILILILIIIIYISIITSTMIVRAGREAIFKNQAGRTIILTINKTLLNDIKKLLLK